MKLKKLLKSTYFNRVIGSKEIEITALTTSSKAVAPGNLFIAKRGGAKFISEAINAGASAILTDMYDPFLKEDVVQVISSDLSKTEAQMASAFYQFSPEELFLVGITGTNGKTTTSYLIKHLLDSLNDPCGLIGTVEWIVGENVYPSTHTTPDLITNYKLFHEMVESGCKAAVMEVSSHGIDQERVQGIAFDVAIFTNLTQDHLDYHASMDAYAQTKAKLFENLAPQKTAIINADSDASSIMFKNCHAHLITYSIDRPSDLFARNIRMSESETQFEVNYKGEKIPFTTPLIGRFNIYNTLAAAATLLTRGYTLKEIASHLKTFKGAAGRLDRVPTKANFHLFVDYAHTEDALRNVLSTLNELKTKRLITLFGCGGCRDQGKRPKMGQVAENLSDVLILTTDNPRSEDPKQIMQQILSGIKNPTQAIVEYDRKKAIEHAINMAEEGDIVLLAGKGHETYQIFAHETIAFDDRQIAQEIILNRYA